MISSQQLCMRCMSELPAPGGSCPVCGGNNAALTNAPHQLPCGSLLDQTYLVGCAMGQGGFGITYIGWDVNLDIKVAIKEYYPEGCVTRESTRGSTLLPVTGQRGEYFQAGRDRFVKEAKILAKFSGEPGIVGVRSFFMENGTAYIVMDYVAGQTLKKYADSRGGRLPAREVLSLLKPLFYAMDKVHSAGLLHRDISPDNIMLQPDGTVKLLDFGAARQMSAMGEHSNTVNVKPGFAPEEQYRTRGEQGPWTDVYALAATIYRLTTGVTPPQSLDRQMGSDVLTPPRALGADLTQSQEDAVLYGMAVLARERFQSMRAFYNALYSDYSASGRGTGSGVNPGPGTVYPNSGMGTGPGVNPGPGTVYPNSGRGAGPGVSPGPGTVYPNSGMGTGPGGNPGMGTGYPASGMGGGPGVSPGPGTGYPNSGMGAGPGVNPGPGTGYPNSGMGTGPGVNDAEKTGEKHKSPMKLIAIGVWALVCVVAAALLIQRGCKSSDPSVDASARVTGEAAPAQETAALGETAPEAGAAQEEEAPPPQAAPKPQAYTLAGAYYSYTQDGLDYEIYENGAKLTGFENGQEQETLAIPDQVEGVPVTVIGEQAFFCCSDITSLTLPSQLKSIEAEAFVLCWHIEQPLTLPEGLETVGEMAFESCSFTSLTIPSTLHTIGRDAFVSCDHLEYIQVAQGNAWYADDNKTALLTIDYTEMMNYAMMSQATSYSVPEGVKTINTSVFAGANNLRELILPASVKNMSMSLVSDYYYPGSLERIQVSEDNPNFASRDGILYSKDGKELVAVPCKHPMEEFSLPEGVEKIREYAMAYCTNLRSVVLSNSVISIGEGAFSNCWATEIQLNEGLAYIGVEAFYYSELIQITLPSTLSQLGSRAFVGCGDLTKVIIADGAQSIGEKSFSGCEALTQLHIPPSVSSIGRNAVEDCAALTIYGQKGSLAEEFAQSAGVPFVEE